MAEAQRNIDSNRGAAAFSAALARRQALQTQIEAAMNAGAEKANLGVMGTIGAFWEHQLSMAPGGALDVALVTDTKEGEPTCIAIAPNQVTKLDRTDPVWKGTVIDHGETPVSIVINRVDSAGRRSKTTVQVVPFIFSVGEEESSCLRPTQLYDSQASQRGVVLRGKA